MDFLATISVVTKKVILPITSPPEEDGVYNNLDWETYLPKTNIL